MNIWIFVIIGLCSLYFIGPITERRTWNKGICKENGIKWVYFDTDSQGGRGYKAGNIKCWISWPRVDCKYRSENEIKTQF